MDNVGPSEKCGLLQAVAPKRRMIKNCKGKTPLFGKYNLEEQSGYYQEQVNLKSGGYIIINPTEAMITIDINSGQASTSET